MLEDWSQDSETEVLTSDRPKSLAPLRKPKEYSDENRKTSS